MIGKGDSNAGETYLISRRLILRRWTQADGTEDGVIDLANVQNGTASSYRFVGADAYGLDPATRYRPLVMWMGMADADLLIGARGGGWASAMVKIPGPAKPI